MKSAQKFIRSMHTHNFASGATEYSSQPTAMHTQNHNDSHQLLVGYLMWLFGFFGLHRFYYGKKITGVIWAFTLGLCFIGWIVDFFLMPSLDKGADRKYLDGPFDYSIAWVLWLFLGVFGVHRFYMGKWITGIIYLCTGGLFAIGWIYDLLTLNEQLDDVNREALQG